MLNIIHMSLAGPIQTIVVAGKTYLFEWHPYSGPTVLNKDESVKSRQPGPRNPYWNAVIWWDEQGRAFHEDGTCKWAEPPKPPLYHLGGNNYTESKSLAAEHGVTEPVGVMT